MTPTEKLIMGCIANAFSPPERWAPRTSEELALYRAHVARGAAAHGRAGGPEGRREASSTPIPLRKRTSDRALLELLVAKVDALAAAVAELSRAPAAPSLVDALRDHFGGGRFTSRGLLAICNDDPHRTLADELANVIDWSATPHARAVAIGMLLGRLPGIELAGESRGVRVWRVRD